MSIKMKKAKIYSDQGKLTQNAICSLERKILYYQKKQDIIRQLLVANINNKKSLTN